MADLSVREVFFGDITNVRSKTRIKNMLRKSDEIVNVQAQKKFLVDYRFLHAECIEAPRFRGAFSLVR